MTGGLLVITAHPDDEVLIAGGTLAACAELGLPTSVVCLTRGENGPIADRRLASRRTLAAVRRQELRVACAELGVEFVKCYRRQDGSLRWANRAELSSQLAGVIDKRRPEAVISFGPDGLYYHPDHIATYELARMGVRRAAYQAALYRSVWVTAELCELAGELRRRGLPHGLWGLDLDELGVDEDERGEEVVVDVRRFVAQKLSALYCHRTQLEPGNALLTLPDDLAERLLGRERFARVDRRSSSLLTRLAREVAHA